MARRKTTAAAHGRVRTYNEILDDKIDRLARKAIAKLITKFRIPEFEIKKRIDIFGAIAYLGTGRRSSERFTIDRKRAERLAGRLRRNAADFRNALTPQFKLVISCQISVDFICDAMGRAATLIEASVKETDARSADWTLEPKRELTQFIWRTTGRPCDAVVADIIAAILSLEKYTSEEQRKFRARCCRIDGPDFIVRDKPKPDKIPRIND